MERLDVIKNNLDYPCFTLCYNNNILLNIWFAGNLDLYFSILGDNKFIIDESNIRVYDIFNKLYNDLINCKLPFDYGDKEILKKLSNYDLLVHDNVITWMSDDYSCLDAPSFSISKLKDKINITFDKGSSVRIRNSGSLYQPFNTNFMMLYHELCNLDLEQVYIDEIIDLKRVKK
jgi:hypothetical protein